MLGGVGFAELRLIYLMYEFGMMLWYKIMSVWRGKFDRQVWVRFGAGK